MEERDLKENRRPDGSRENSASFRLVSLSDSPNIRTMPAVRKRRGGASPQGGRGGSSQGEPSPSVSNVDGTNNGPGNSVPKNPVPASNDPQYVLFDPPIFSHGMYNTSGDYGDFVPDPAQVNNNTNGLFHGYPLHTAEPAIGLEGDECTVRWLTACF